MGASHKNQWQIFIVYCSIGSKFLCCTVFVTSTILLKCFGYCVICSLSAFLAADRLQAEFVLSPIANLI